MELSNAIYTAEVHKRLKNILLLIIGTILFSIYAGLLIPVNNIGAGGALGLSLVLNRYKNRDSSIFTECASILYWI